MFGAYGSLTVIRRLSLLWRRFSPLEERLLAEVRGVLPVLAVPIFDAQVAAINHVQRIPPSWAEIDLYRLRRRRPAWGGVPTFPCTDEFRLAEVRFGVAGQQYKAILSSIAGHIFDFAILPGPKSVAFAPWEGAATTSLLGDPLRRPTGRKEPEQLPEQWKQLLAQYTARGPHGWTLYDEMTAYRVMCDDAQYLVLAEVEGPQFILHRVDPPGEYLYWLEHHDGIPERLAREPEAVV